MKVADYDGFHVFDIVPGLFDLSREFERLIVVDAGEDVVDGGADDFGVVLGMRVSLGRVRWRSNICMVVGLYLLTSPAPVS